MNFPSFKPSLDANSENVLIQCIKDQAISGNYGAFITNVERDYSRLHNNYYSVTCSSGTSALHLACLGLGVSKNHTVVVPATTNMATFFAPMYIGAKVLSCDVNRDDGLIDFESLEDICINQKVDFVIVVHLYGHVVNTTKLKVLQKKFNFLIIEDCAEAHFGKDEKNNFVGSNFDAGCFSFYANKIISGGEGGIVLFKENDAAKKARNLKNLAFGDNQSISKFFHKEIGFNYRLNNLSAGLIWQSISKRDAILEARRRIESMYTSIFERKEYVELIPSKLSSYRVNWVYCIKFKPFIINKFESKNHFLRSLSMNGVEARDFFYPADHQEFFFNYAKEKKYKYKNTINSLKFYESSIYLPVYNELTNTDIEEIVLIIEKTIDK